VQAAAGITDDENAAEAVAEATLPTSGNVIGAVGQQALCPAPSEKLRGTHTDCRHMHTQENNAQTCILTRVPTCWPI
jgi:hypothetical protein